MRTATDGGGQRERVTLRPQVTVTADSDVGAARRRHADVPGLCFIARSVSFPVAHEPTVRTIEPAAAKVEQTAHPAREERTDMSDVQVTNNPEQHRYEARIDGELAGFAEYQLTDDLAEFTHTEVDPAFEGKGVGSALARYGLDDVREQGTRRVKPTCPFIKGWIERHREYEPLVYGG